MAFKLGKPPYTYDPTPVYHTPMEEGTLGKANNNGTIIINKNLPASELEEVVKHEKVHIDQMRRGDLDYTHDTVTWKGKTVARQSITEGGHNLPWEKEAYAKVPKSKK